MNSSRPLLTIAIPTYNRSEFLMRTLLYNLNEASHHHGKVEIIVSNNSSTDDTNKVVKELQRSYDFQYHLQEKNLGATENILYIPEHLARGKFCWVIGDDDFIIPGSIEKILNAIVSIDKLTFIFASALHMDAKIIKKLDQFENFEEIKKILKKQEPGLAENQIIKFDKLIDPDIRTDYLGFISNGIFNLETWKSVNIDHIQRQYFLGWESTYPNIYIYGKAFIGKIAYYFSEPIVVCGDGIRDWASGNFWDSKLPVIYLQYFDEILDHYKKNNIDELQYKKCKSNQAKIQGKYFIDYINNRYIKNLKNKSINQIKISTNIKYITNRNFWMPIIKDTKILARNFLKKNLSNKSNFKS